MTNESRSYDHYDSPEAIAKDQILSQQDKLNLLGDWAVSLLDSMFAQNDNARVPGKPSHRVDQLIDDLRLVTL